MIDLFEMNKEDSNHNIFFESTSDIICLVLIFCFFIIGIYLHIRIVLISKKDKEMTWTLDATNSCLVLIHYLQNTLMIISTMLVKDLYLYTGRWFCYFSNFLSYYGTRYVETHSLVIVSLKYVHIVYWIKVKNFGKEKINKIFFWINLLHPALMILIHLIITPHFFIIWSPYIHVDRCLGLEKGSGSVNSTKERPKLHDLCIAIQSPFAEDYIGYILFLLEKSTCWIQTIAHYLTFSNVIDVILYFFIFRFMHR